MATEYDPVERLNVDLEILAIPQTPGLPPMTDTYMHVRRRQDGSGGRAVLGLPAFRGDKGDTGPAGMIHQGDRTSAELEGLEQVLGPDELNYTYRNVDTDDQYVWNGENFVVYQGAYGAQGEAGPPPVMEGGTVTIDGELHSDPVGVEVVPGDGPGEYVVNVELPAMPKGDRGPAGPSGSVYDSVDVDGDPEDGDTLVHDAAAGKLVWRPFVGMLPTFEEYVVPPQNFPTADKASGDVRHELCAVTLPARPYRYRIEATGGVDVEAHRGHQIDVEVRVGDPVSGELIGYGRGQDGEGWREVAIRPHSEVAIIPGSDDQVIEPNTEVTVYASAVKKAGVVRGWAVRQDRANLRLRLVGVA